MRNTVFLFEKENIKKKIKTTKRNSVSVKSPLKIVSAINLPSTRQDPETPLSDVHYL